MTMKPCALTSWFFSSNGMFPWFENNQGFLSVLALALTAAALWWEFRQAREAELDAARARADAAAKELKAVSEAEAKDRKALLTARWKEQEDRITRERDEIVGFCFTINQTFEALQQSARLERNRLALATSGDQVRSSDFVAEGYRVKRAVEALMARPPSDHDAILAVCQGLEIFSSWPNLEVIYDPGTMGTAIDAIMVRLTAAQERLAEAREDAVNWYHQQVARIGED